MTILLMMSWYTSLVLYVHVCCRTF